MKLVWVDKGEHRIRTTMSLGLVVFSLPNGSKRSHKLYHHAKMVVGWPSVSEFAQLVEQNILSTLML